MYESEVKAKAAVKRISNGTAARTSFQDSRSHVTFSFSEWRIMQMSELQFYMHNDQLI